MERALKTILPMVWQWENSDGPESLYKATGEGTLSLHPLLPSLLPYPALKMAWSTHESPCFPVLNDNSTAGNLTDPFLYHEGKEKLAVIGFSYQQSLSETCFTIIIHFNTKYFIPRDRNRK